MATNLDRVVRRSSHDEFSPTKSHDPLITWSFEITCQTRNIISSVSECLWPPNLTGLLFTVICSYPQSHITLWSQSHITLWSCGPTRSRDKLKPFHLYYQSSYGRQTWQDADLPSVPPTHKVTERFSHIVLQDHKTI